MPIRRFSGVGGGAGSGAYGSVPTLPTTGALQGNVSNILNSAIPGYSGLSQGASSIIGDAMAGRLPGDVQNVIKSNAATQAVMSGMPGSSAVGGTLMGNRTLRDLGLTSLQRQDSGVRDLISMLQGVSGTAAPTFGQAQDQENARATFAAAPDPRAAAQEQERLFNKYSEPQLSTQTGTSSQLPWYVSPLERRLIQGGGWYSVDPLTGVPKAGRPY